MSKNTHTIKYYILLGLFVIIGILLGHLCWTLIPKGWEYDSNKRFLIEYSLAKDLQQSGNIIAAENSFRSAIQINTKRYEAYLGYGNLLLSRGDTNTALSNYNQALKYCGKSPTNILSQEMQLHERKYISAIIQRLCGK